MTRALQSWGRYPRFPQTPHSIFWRNDVATTLRAVGVLHGQTLAFGNGRSYGDSCLAVSDHVLHMRGLDRIMLADWDTGVVRAEAGLTIDELLKICVPRGWFIPVTPGTRYVTLGGAVANDVHGKNHHRRGTFGRHVRAFGLIRSDGEELTCTSETNADMFSATIGGLGLTGIMPWVEIQLSPIRSSSIDAVSVRFDNLAGFFTVARELEHTHEYTAAWIDCVATGASFGRGFFLAGNHASDGPLAPHRGGGTSVPLTPPWSPLTRISLRAFNTLIFHRQPAQRRSECMNYDAFLYPLDRIADWNRLYGRSGFQQYQCLLPDAAAHDAVAELLRLTADAGQGSFLAVLKRFGDISSPGLMSFPAPGTTLALDFPERGAVTEQLFSRLDAVVRTARGRLYPAKDAHMKPEDFRAAYPQWERLEALRDPAISSRFWARMMQ